MTTTATAPSCPTCSGPMWDETKSKFYKPGKPIFKCRDKACSGVIWAPKGATQAPAPATKQPVSHGPLMPWEDEGAGEEEAKFVETVTAEPAKPLTANAVEWNKARTRYIDTLQWVLEAVEPRLANYEKPTLAELLTVTHTLYIERNKRGC